MKALSICSIAFIFTIGIYSQWIPLVTNTTADLQDVFFIDVNTGIAAGSNGIVIRTTNAGLNWVQITSPVSQSIFTLCFPVAATGYASGNTGFIIKSTNSGFSWNSAASCGINVRSISFINALTGITGGGGSLMCYTTNGGSSWNPKYTPTSHAVTGLHYYSAALLMVSATDMPGAVLHKSTDGGTGWSTVLTQNNSGLNTTYSLSSVYCKDENTIFAMGSSNSYGQNYGLIYRSSNGGNNWETVRSIGPSAGYNMKCIHFGDIQSGFAIGSEGIIMRSTNTGANWETQISGTSVSLNGIHMLNSLTGYICGSGGLILKTTNGGITALTPISSEIPEHFELYQNYPNPFNPVTNIRFDVAFDSRLRGNDNVVLKIYDILGSEIITLVNEQLQPGTYEVMWDAGNHSSGIYYYSLSAGDNKNTEKMILLK